MRKTCRPRWAFLWLLGVLWQPAPAQETSSATPGPSYSVQFFEVQPPAAGGIAWDELAAPGLQAQSPTVVDARPASSATTLYTARLPAQAVPQLLERLQQWGAVSAQASAPMLTRWGYPSQYRQRQALRYVREVSRPVIGGRGIPTGVVLDSVDTHLTAAVTSLPGAPGTSRLELRWQQVTGWARTEQKGYQALLQRARNTTIQRTPLLTYGTAQRAVPLAAGEALFLAGIPSLAMAPDGSAEINRELAVLLIAQ